MKNEGGEFTVNQWAMPKKVCKSRVTGHLRLFIPDPLYLFSHFISYFSNPCKVFIMEHYFLFAKF